MKQLISRRQIFVGLLILGLQGCQHPCRQPDAAWVPSPTLGTPRAPVGTLQAPPDPVPAGPDARRYGDPATLGQATWRPQAPEGEVRLWAADGLSSTKPKEPVRLLPPEPLDPAIAPKAKPLPTDANTASPALPVGIQQFNIVKDKLAAGLKPDLDGLGWLKDNGYATIVHVRGKGEDDVADRRAVEIKDIKFFSIELSAQDLSKDSVDEFSRIIGDTTLAPVFVYDKDGIAAGALWYLHFLNVDKLTENEARTKSARLGLKEATAIESQPMWLALKEYLDKQAK